VELPLGVVTVMGPVVAPGGTVALMLLEVVAGVPLKLTPVAPRRNLPFTVTTTPVAPLVGTPPMTSGWGGGRPRTQTQALAIDHGRGAALG